MWTFDRETRQFLAVNDAAVAMYGWSREELLAMKLEDVRPPEERAAMAAGFAAPRETLKYGRRGKHWNKRGEVIELHVELRCIERDGREIGVAMATNLTGLADLERRFRLLLEHSGEAIALTNERGVVEYLSPAGERIFGCPASEVIGTVPVERVHPDDARTWKMPSPFETLVQQVRLRHRELGWRWVECSMTNLMLDPAVHGFVSNFRDVTERRETQADLERSEANFRSLIERSPMATLVHREGRHVYVNPAAAALLGYDSPDEIIGRAVIDFIHPDDRDLVRARIKRTVDTGETPAGEARMVRRDGTMIVVEAEGLRLDFDGKPSNVVIGRDVTERRELLARMALADRMLTVGALAAGVAHEINNPLAYVATNLEILAHEAPPHLAGLIADAREGVERVSGIVRELRALAKPEDAERGPVDVVAVLASSIKMAHNEIRHRARVIERYPAELPPVRVNGSRLGQVFLNLLLNAAQAIPEGRADANEIRVSATTHDGEVIIEIEDTGAGIPGSIIKRIFDPFFTTKAPGVGMGLGLTISHQIVRAMDGQITVSSRPGSGTTFTVTLPAAPTERPAPRAPDTVTSSMRARILVIDDEPAVGRSLCAMLARSHEPTGVTHAHDALELLRAGNEYDVILCDLMMPEVSGIDLYRLLAPADRERIVFMTGGAFTPQAREFLAKTPDLLHLEKPFPERELREAIDRITASRGTRRDPPPEPQ
jgi:PAS domain S-box-containing protein